MKNKILFSFLSLALVLGGFISLGASTAHAQVVPSFPTGCTSALGYSVTDGTPCNGTNSATTSVNGCVTALGYSITNGTPCDGASVAIQYLAGCGSIYGYTSISNVPCNGTMVASVYNPYVTPGLPVTGAGGDAFLNSMLLLASGIIVLVGSTFLVRRYKTVA